MNGGKLSSSRSRDLGKSTKGCKKKKNRNKKKCQGVNKNTITTICSKCTGSDDAIAKKCNANKCNGDRAMIRLSSVSYFGSDDYYAFTNSSELNAEIGQVVRKSQVSVSASEGLLANDVDPNDDLDGNVVVTNVEVYEYTQPRKASGTNATPTLQTTPDPLSGNVSVSVSSTGEFTFVPPQVGCGWYTFEYRNRWWYDVVTNLTSTTATSLTDTAVTSVTSDEWIPVMLLLPRIEPNLYPVIVCKDKVVTTIGAPFDVVEFMHNSCGLEYDTFYVTNIPKNNGISGYVRGRDTQTRIFNEGTFLINAKVKNVLGYESNCNTTVIVKPKSSRCSKAEWEGCTDKDGNRPCCLGLTCRRTRLCQGEICRQESRCVPAKPPPVKRLSFGQEEQIGLATSEKAVYYFTDFPVNGAMICSITANNGDADLYLRFDSSPTTTTNDFSSVRFGSNELIGPFFPTGPSVSRLFVMVHAYSGFSGATFRCRKAPSPSQLTQGRDTSVTLNNDAIYYSLQVPAHNQVQCSISGDGGDADLFIKFDTLPTPINNLFQGTSFGSNEVLPRTSPESTDRTLYVMVLASTNNTAIEVFLRCDVTVPASPTELTPGQNETIRLLRFASPTIQSSYVL